MVSPSRSQNTTTTQLMGLKNANLNNRFSALTVEVPNNAESTERDKGLPTQPNSNQNKGRYSEQSVDAKQNNGAKVLQTLGNQ